ncbi:uncharacterized protein LOC116265450 isoform X2 [Nymphaea colorata]|uniref:uncharacterized protein LOC116265450 isoform X2 n=1 Tax=Nymphaea colorata TaxID=210225 RepID=UPI00214F4E30|nr:uncharacterized protein LOC116265450 isoform X2 [Nymphaea colorata]
METELEPTVKPLAYKIKSVSRESPAQKAAHVLDTDLRSHWSSGTNTKEWILFELEEPCLLSHIRIHNKSVLEWEIAVGLRYKPEAFMKVRPRCEAPRRDMVYPMNYVPCRYLRISCLRGNPIAIFFIQLIGIPVAGLESEFQPVVDHLLPNIISYKQDANNIYLQLLKDITRRLLPFLPQLEGELSTFLEAAETNIRFLAMLAGPFYPILFIANEREIGKTSGDIFDSDGSRNNQISTLTVSSNFEVQPRRVRSPSSFPQPAACSIAFRPSSVLMLLRKAYKDTCLGTIARLAARVLQKLMVPDSSLEAVSSSTEASAVLPDEVAKMESHALECFSDYSCLFGEEFKINGELSNIYSLSFLDSALVEEGILHILYACAAEPLLCSKLHDCGPEFWFVLPLIQALLPALRPSLGSPMDQVDESFTHWKQPMVQQALAQIVTLSSSSIYHPLLDGCASYLSSNSPSHVKAACVLIDLCSGPLAPWIPRVVAKVDLTMELLEDLLPIIQGGHYPIERASAALKYIMLALSGSMDDILAKYKEVKHKLLFLVEMLGPYLNPAIVTVSDTTFFGDVSMLPIEKQEQNCAMALNIIRTAVSRSAVLPSLESEWKRGSVAPSVLLAVLGPDMQLPYDIDICKSSVGKGFAEEYSAKSQDTSIQHDGTYHKSHALDDFGKKAEASDISVRKDFSEDANLLFAPSELKKINLRNYIHPSEDNMQEKQCNAEIGLRSEEKFNNNLVLDLGFDDECFQLEANYIQLVNHQVCELRASEFRRLALELHSQDNITAESHDAAVDSLLLSAECHVNPFFLRAVRPCLKLMNGNSVKTRSSRTQDENTHTTRKFIQKGYCDLETVATLERKRDKTVLQILLEAAEMDCQFYCSISNDEQVLYDNTDFKESIQISPLDLNAADAVTLVRQNQGLLSQFLVNRLKKDQHSMHEILMQSLLFLLHSATGLCCPPECIIDIILESAEHLNRLLTSFYFSFKDGKTDPEKVHEARRRWVLLQRLVIASSGSDNGALFVIDGKGGSRHRCLVPPSSWIERIPSFSSCPLPLVRFIGWMGVSRYAKQCVKDGMLFGLDLPQITTLLSIFADELASLNNVSDQKSEPVIYESFGSQKQPSENEGFNNPSKRSHAEGFLRVLYPEFYKYFPNMKMQFETFSEDIMEAVCLQLRSFSSSFIPDVLGWFSDLCLWQREQPYDNQIDHVKGYAAKNVKAVTLYLLEAIVSEHMGAMVPEIPRVVQILVSMCRTSYCDVDFLESILRILKPLISYGLPRVSKDEINATDDSSCLDFESLCFDTLLSIFKCGTKCQTSAGNKLYRGALMIFLFGALFTDMSVLKRQEVLQSLISWAEFTNFEPTSAFYDYLRAFENVMESCTSILIDTLGAFGIFIAAKKSSLSDKSAASCLSVSSVHGEPYDDTEDAPTYSLQVETGSLKHNSYDFKYFSSSAEVVGFCKDLESLIFKLFPAIELCWQLHHQLAKRLCLATANCYLYSTCLLSICQSTNREVDSINHIPFQVSMDESSMHWKNALESFANGALVLEQNLCWHGASVMLDFLLGLPCNFKLDHVLSSICLAIKNFCCHSPKITWRLQTDKWLSSVLCRFLTEDGASSLVDLLCVMLEHSEPEQQFVALKHLQGLLAQGSCGGVGVSAYEGAKPSDIDATVPESFIRIIVSKTWDRVAVLASSDPSMLLRSHAVALLSTYVPFTGRGQLQSFLGAADTVLPGLSRLAYSLGEGPLRTLSLTLLATACLYSPMEDILLLPQNVWKNLEVLGTSKLDGRIGDMEKMVCQALCKLRSEGQQGKEVLQEVLATKCVKQPVDPDFEGTRESIIQVLASLTSAQSYFDFFSSVISSKNVELEEVEMELELLKKDIALKEASENLRETNELPVSATMYVTGQSRRLEQLKAEIQKLEKEKLREEVAARRQKKLIARHARHQFLEDAALRELELLQELDRERTKEAEHEIERQRLLEQERAKTRELRHNLEMEMERRTQAKLQRELEQRDSGPRSRREFSSSAANSRPRERYRERDSGRPAQEGSLRPSSAGSGGREGAITPPPAGGTNATSATPLVLGSSRTYAVQPPLILKSRERTEERTYDDNIDGSRDSGDAGSIGDPDSSSVDGTSVGYGASHRHGSRSGKPRQIVERRERDGRREGKWERKHS